jgi:hypothetical protein
MIQNLPPVDVAVAEVVDYLRITGGFASAVAQVVERKITVEAAREAGLEVSSGELQRAGDAFRAAHGHHKASETHAWLAANDISLEAFQQHVETNLLIGKFKDLCASGATRDKYLSAPNVKECIRETVFQDWLNKVL